MQKSPVDPFEEISKAGIEATERAMHRAEVLAYQMFGHKVEPYVAADSQAERHPRWLRVFVKLHDDLPEFNYVQGSKEDPERFGIGADCPECGYWVAKYFVSPEGLARIQESPVLDCSRCKWVGRLTEVNVLL